MTIGEFKKVARFLKEVYKELEEEALESNVDIFGEEFAMVRDAARERVLARLGFTIEEYREAKEQVAPAKKQSVAESLLEASKSLQEVSSRVDALKIPTEEEIDTIAQNVAKEYIQPPQIINKIERETVIEKPTIVKETKVEQITNREEYDDRPLFAEIGYLNDRLDNLPPVPEMPDIDELAEKLRSEFQENLDKNINALGMPDFRKLAMGLQAQIDSLSNQPSTGDIILQSPNGTNWQIGITNAGELTATEV